MNIDWKKVIALLNRVMKESINHGGDRQKGIIREDIVDTVTRAPLHHEGTENNALHKEDEGRPVPLLTLEEDTEKVVRERARWIKNARVSGPAIVTVLRVPLMTILNQRRMITETKKMCLG